MGVLFRTHINHIQVNEFLWDLHCEIGNFWVNVLVYQVSLYASYYKDMAENSTIRSTRI